MLRGNKWQEEEQTATKASREHKPTITLNLKIYGHCPHVRD
jgi:hypothetical protein